MGLRRRVKFETFQGSLRNLTVCSGSGLAEQLVGITEFILLREKFLQFDSLRAVVFQLNLKYLHVKITNLLGVVV